MCCDESIETVVELEVTWTKIVYCFDDTKFLNWTLNWLSRSSGVTETEKLVKIGEQQSEIEQISKNIACGNFNSELR